MQEGAGLPAEVEFDTLDGPTEVSISRAVKRVPSTREVMESGWAKGLVSWTVGREVGHADGPGAATDVARAVGGSATSERLALLRRRVKEFIQGGALFVPTTAPSTRKRTLAMGFASVAATASVSGYCGHLRAFPGLFQVTTGPWCPAGR